MDAERRRPQGAKRPISAPARGLLGYKRVGGAYVRFAGEARRVVGVFAPPPPAKVAGRVGFWAFLHRHPRQKSLSLPDPTAPWRHKHRVNAYVAKAGGGDGALARFTWRGEARTDAGPRAHVG